MFAPPAIFSWSQLSTCQYDVAQLKSEALVSIKSSLSPHNILEELFSTFTYTCVHVDVYYVVRWSHCFQTFGFRYPAIRDMELQYLYDNCKESGVQTRLPTWLEAMEEGNLPKGAAYIMNCLISHLINAPPQIVTVTEPGMKACPNGCTAFSYRCNGCSRTF